MSGEGKKALQRRLAENCLKRHRERNVGLPVKEHAVAGEMAQYSGLTAGECLIFMRKGMW